MHLFQGMQDNEVEELLERLTAYARRLIRKVRWRGDTDGQAPGGKEAHDIVHDVVLKYERGLTHPHERGARRINPQVDLPGNLMGGVRSAVDALLRRKENQHEERLTTEPKSDGPSLPDPERAAMYSERTEAVYNRLLEAALEDDDLTAALEVLEARGEYTAGELEEALGLTTNQAKALRRRFSRALDRAIQASEEESNG